MRRLFASLVILFTLGGVRASAQPSTLPLLQPSDITYGGSFTLPQSDGTCNDTRAGCMTYSGWGLSIGPLVNGQPTLLVGGHDWQDQVCPVFIPASGSGRATIARPCFWLPNYKQIDPGDAGNGFVFGGAVPYNNRVIYSMFTYYDGDGSTTKSHWASSSTFSGFSGPVQLGTLGAGRVAGYMMLIPQEWRAAFGGPAMTGLGGTSIIHRSSAGPAISVFNPDQVGKVEPVPATPVMNFPLDHALDTANPSTLYNHAFQFRGVGFPSGTRSVLFVARGPVGEVCYGEADCSNPPDTVEPYKGYHGMPYHNRVQLYDANLLLESKDGKRAVWNHRPYANMLLPGPAGPTDPLFAQRATLAGATYDDTTRRIYAMRITGDGVDPVVYWWRVGKGAPVPVDRDCVGAWGPWAVTHESACVEGFRHRIEERTFTITQDRQGNGKACEATNGQKEQRTSTPTCTVTPPPTEAYPGTVVAVRQLAGGTWVLDVMVDGTTRPYLLTADMPNPPKVGDRILMTVDRR